MAAPDYSEFKRKLETELNPEGFQATHKSYSEAYRTFKAEQVSAAHTFYEKACGFSERLLSVKINQKEAESIQSAITLTHLAVTPAGVKALAYLVTALLLLATVSIGLLFFNVYLLIIGPLVALLALYLLPKVPEHVLNIWRAKASDQLVTAVLYMIIYMEHTPNLERAVYFAASNLSPPLSLDFAKLLWDVEIKRYATISAALENYLTLWRGRNNEFIESIQLLESSLYLSSETRRQETLARAIDTLLNGVHDHMLNYAHKLQGPVQTIHMLGIVLPVMGLVMLPLVGAFLGDAIKWWHIILLYNIFLPLVIYALAKSVLSTRPSGANNSDIYDYRRWMKSSKTLTIGRARISLSPKLFGLAIFLIIFIPAAVYFWNLLATLTGAELRDALSSIITISMSTLFVLAVGFGYGAYNYLSAQSVIKAKRETSELEEEFATAIFELGNRMRGDAPVEGAFARVATLMKDSPVAKMFNLITYNITKRGMDLRDAIFDPKVGALAYYPSAIIKSVMNVLVEGSKKGAQIVATSLVTISRYLINVHKVNERLKDLLADTLASMQMQIKLFVPIIAGIVVGLAALTTTVLLRLGVQFSSLDTSSSGDFSVGSAIVSIFQLENMLPSFLFQIVVGIYVIQLLFLLSYLVNGIIYGYDDVELRYALGQNLFIGTTIYVVVVIITTIMFTSMTAGMV